MQGKEKEGGVRMLGLAGAERQGKGKGTLTVDHVLDCFFVILAKVDHTGACFLKLAAASAVEKARPRTQDCAMDGP